MAQTLASPSNDTTSLNSSTTTATAAAIVTNGSSSIVNGSSKDPTVTTTGVKTVDNNNNNNSNVINKLDDEKDASLLAIGTKNELPLQFRWSLWYSAPKTADIETHKWDTERAKQIVEFGSVEEFWRVFNNLTPPSNLSIGADFQLFRSGVKPAWEDSFNAKGGTWTIKVPKEDIAKFDTIWFNTVLTMIGDNFDDADDICGIAVSARSKFNRVQLWTRYADDRDACLRIGMQLKDINRLKSNSRIQFVSHDDARDFSKVSKPSEILL